MDVTVDPLLNSVPDGGWPILPLEASQTSLISPDFDYLLFTTPVRYSLFNFGLVFSDYGFRSLLSVAAKTALRLTANARSFTGTVLVLRAF